MKHRISDFKVEKNCLTENENKRKLSMFLICFFFLNNNLDTYLLKAHPQIPVL